MAAAARRLVDIGEVARLLASQAPSLCAELLPHGVRRHAEWQCGSLAGEPGHSLSVHLTGAKAGVWSDFASGEAGDALDLVAEVLFRGDKRAALDWARRWLGLDTGDPAALETARRKAPSKEQLDAQAEAEAAQTRANAKRIWLAAHPAIADTPVDWYLRGRGINLARLGRQPRALRFHPALWNRESGRHWPAMVATIVGPSGFLATHRTWLEVTGDGKARKAPLDNNKMTLGVFRGGHIPLWRGASGKRLADADASETVNITEGIEDGLTVAYSIPAERTLAAVSLSNMAALALPTQIKTLQVWKQNDKAPEAIEAFERVLAAHIRAGREILIPEIPPDLKDVNDLLRSVAQ